MNTTKRDDSLPLNKIEALLEKIDQLEFENRILKEALENKPPTQVIKPQGIGESQSEPKAPNLKTANKQAEIIAALAILYTKTDCSKPFEAAETIHQAWELRANELGKPPKKDTIAKYIQQGVNRLSP